MEQSSKGPREDVNSSMSHEQAAAFRHADDQADHPNNNARCSVHADVVEIEVEIAPGESAEPVKLEHNTEHNDAALARPHASNKGHAEVQKKTIQDVLQVAVSCGVLACSFTYDFFAARTVPQCTPVVGVIVSIMFTLRNVWLRCFPLDMRTVPMMVVILLVCIGAPVSAVKDGILGSPKLRPLNVMVIFFGMAYICISLDQTGVLRHLALRAAARTKGPRSVFVVIALLTGVLTLVTSNDIVILTLTPIIIDLSRAKGYDPYPFLYLQFVTANVWSISLVIGNPTNVIVADAAGLRFAEYAAKLAPVGVVTGVAAVLTLYVRYRKQLSGIRDLANAGDVCEETLPLPEDKFMQIRAKVCMLRLGALLTFAVFDALHKIPLWIAVGVACSAAVLLDAVMDIAHIDKSSRMLVNTLLRMPWEVLPFALSLFVIVEVLDRAELVAVLARALSAAFGHSLSGTCFGVGIVSVLACQLLNNQPMTVLLTKVLIHPDFKVQGQARDGAMLALIVGSNLGANVTLIGALAGPMWASLIKRRGLIMTSSLFVQQMLSIIPFVALASFGSLLLELVLYNELGM